MTLSDQEFAALWNDRAIPTKAIAARLGVTRAAVSWRAHKLKLPSRLVSAFNDDALFTFLWRARVSPEEIAAHFGLASRASVSRHRAALGLAPREKGGVGGAGGYPPPIPLARALKLWAAPGGPRLPPKPRRAPRKPEPANPSPLKGKPAARGRTVTAAEFKAMWGDRIAWPTQRIADHLGISTQAVRGRARSRGLPPRGPDRPRQALLTTAEDRATFSSMWVSGVRTKDIAAHFGATTAWPSDAARKLGLPPRSSRITLEEWRQAQLAAAMRASAEETKRAAELQRTRDREFLRRAA